MHLLFENVLKKLIQLMTGRIHKVNEGHSEHQLARTVWEAIMVATDESGKTIPSTFGPQCPNMVKDSTPYTAEMMSFFSTYLAPVLLRRRFRREAYYKHFIKHIKLIRTSLLFSLKKEDIVNLSGFIDRVTGYERCFFSSSVMCSVRIMLCV